MLITISSFIKKHKTVMLLTINCLKNIYIAYKQMIGKNELIKINIPSACS